MRLKVFILTIFVLGIYGLNSFAQDEGAGSSGGAGGIEVNGKIYSLSQAGLKINVQESYVFEEKTLDAIDRMAKILDVVSPKSYDYGKYIKGLIFSNDHDYVPVKVVDAKLFESIKNEYNKFLSNLNVKGNFALPAFTSGNTTYLLPEWDSLSPETQALYLVTHESMYYMWGTRWGKKPELTKILNFEIAMKNAIDNETNPEVILRLIDAEVGLKVSDSSSAFLVYVENLIQQGKRITLDLFVDGDFDVIQTPHQEIDGSGILTTIETDRMSLNRNRGLDKDFYRRFNQSRIEIYSGGYYEVGPFVIYNYPPQFGSFLFNTKASNFEVVLEKGGLFIQAIDRTLKSQPTPGKKFDPQVYYKAYLRFKAKQDGLR